MCVLVDSNHDFYFDCQVSRAHAPLARCSRACHGSTTHQVPECQPWCAEHITSDPLRVVRLRGLPHGEFAPLREEEEVHKTGSVLSSPDELLTSVTGGGVSPQPFLTYQYLRAK